MIQSQEKPGQLKNETFFKRRVKKEGKKKNLYAWYLQYLLHKSFTKLFRSNPAVILSFYSNMFGTHESALEVSTFGLSSAKIDMDILELVQLLRNCNRVSKERLRELSLFSLEKRKLWGDYYCLKLLNGKVKRR